MQMSYSYASDLPFKNSCKLAKQAETIKNRFVWETRKLTQYQPGVKSLLLYRGLQNTDSQKFTRADIIHSQREMKEIFEPENSPFH